MSVCAVNPCPGCEQVPVRLRPPLVVDQRLAGMTTVQTLSRVNRTHGTEGGEQKRKTFVFDLVNAPEDIRQSFEPYFTGACLETETDLYVVVHSATKPAHAGVFIENEVRTTAELGQVPGSGVAVGSFGWVVQAVSAGRSSAPISGLRVGTMLMRHRARASRPR